MNPAFEPGKIADSIDKYLDRSPDSNLVTWWAIAILAVALCVGVIVGSSVSIWQ
jgi:hypothetical protein